MPNVARVGDSISHGGSITGPNQSNMKTDGILAAVVGAFVSCAVHGAQTMTTGSGITTSEGKSVCRLGDSVSCGATVTSGSPTTYTD